MGTTLKIDLNNQDDKNKNNKSRKSGSGKCDD